MQHNVTPSNTEKHSETHNDTVVFSVRWPRWLFNAVNSYCQNQERSRNWMIKKRMADSIGLMSKIGDKPDERDDVHERN